MIPIADRLQDYFSQFDEKPGIAPSLKRNAYQDCQLARTGIVFMKTIELPVNSPPKLLNMLLTQGDDLMNTQSTPTRVRIYSHVTQSRFLHVADSLAIGKIRLFGGNYRKGKGMRSHSHAFVDIADARVIFGALAHSEQGFRHKEYKGTPPRNGSDAVSRVLSVAIKGENVYIELNTGPGKLTNTGAIKPNGKPEVEVNIGFKLYEARRMAASVLAYIHAWDVMRMMVNQGMVGQPSSYTLVSATSGVNGDKATPANGTSKSNNATKPPAAASQNGRPVTRKDPAPKATNTNASVTVKQTNGKPEKLGAAVPPTPSLQYGNGHLVDMQNLTEVQTFRQYVAKRKAEPKSKETLLDFYQKGVQIAAGAANQ